MKESQRSRQRILIDEHMYCPKCKYEFTARFDKVSRDQIFVQTRCPRCKYIFKKNIKDIGKTRPSSIPKKIPKHVSEPKENVNEKLYDFFQNFNHIDPNKLQISFYVMSSVISPLIITDTQAKPKLIPNEEIISSAEDIRASIDEWPRKRRLFIECAHKIFEDFGPGNLYRTNRRIIYVRKIQFKIPRIWYISGLRAFQHWKNSGFHESFSLPLPKISDIYFPRRNGSVEITLEEPNKERIYTVFLSPYRKFNWLVDDLKQKARPSK